MLRFSSLTLLNDIPIYSDIISLRPHYRKRMFLLQQYTVYIMLYLCKYFHVKYHLLCAFHILYIKPPLL